MYNKIEVSNVVQVTGTSYMYNKIEVSNVVQVTGTSYMYNKKRPM